MRGAANFSTNTISEFTYLQPQWKAAGARRSGCDHRSGQRAQSHIRFFAVHQSLPEPELLVSVGRELARGDLVVAGLCSACRNT
jgi:hypothetical protein